ncbi:hypothetical protein ORV05_32755 [Amycolatopsis cynarae]|uniref:Uncharacterized protein n=1 Tax=Amycolatopsis cynarae TaxID=2995223 RepID=A0ABY7B0W3_9PSEU|nr:hypothetical protein [Amycolatopsis sp. HUAS 11-8]WAL65600.1 hypothetical protein ORV05_32755 [Amycolatopsis sp. HUAS 11-8]
MSKAGFPVVPQKNTLRKVLWGLVFLALIVWAVKHPYQARDAIAAVMHALSVIFSGGGH